MPPSLVTSSVPYHKDKNPCSLTECLRVALLLWGSFDPRVDPRVDD